MYLPICLSIYLSIYVCLYVMHVLRIQGTWIDGDHAVLVLAIHMCVHLLYRARKTAAREGYQHGSVTRRALSKGQKNIMLLIHIIVQCRTVGLYTERVVNKFWRCLTTRVQCAVMTLPSGSTAKETRILTQINMKVALSTYKNITAQSHQSSSGMLH